MKHGISDSTHSRGDQLEVFYFGEPSRRLFGVLAGPSRNARAGIVFCPPCGEEMITTYARLARWSKQLAKRGFVVLRFHPFGTCESDGAFADFTVDGALQDTATAVRYLRDRIGIKHIGLFGLRFGGFLAAQLATTVQADFLLLWSPIIDLPRYFRELLRMRLTAEALHLQADHVKVTTKKMVEDLEAGCIVDVLGYPFSPAFYRQMTAGRSWPEQPPGSRVLWLSRVAERGQIASLPDGWTSEQGNVDLQLVPEVPFWENFSSVFPEKFAGASEAWLSKSPIIESL